MSFASTAAVLDSLKSRIEALAPPAVYSGDDAFRVTCSTPTDQVSGFRATLVYANAARRNLRTSRTCRDWTTQAAIDIVYNAVPTEAGEQTVLQIALSDAEAILDDLYDWAAITSGILAIEPEEGAAVLDGNGELHMVRQIRINFVRT